MTNTYLRFVNFVGVGSSPTLMPWICGGNFKEDNEVSKWLCENVLNPGIAVVEKNGVSIPCEINNIKTNLYHCHFLPIGDLSYQSKVAGHQGCSATYFSIYWLDVTCDNADIPRDKLQRQTLAKMKEMGEKVRVKWQEIVSDKLINENARDAILQQFIWEENYSQKGAPLLAICECFTPDGLLHGKCSATLALFLTIVEFANSNQKFGKKMLQEIVEQMKRVSGLLSFAKTIEWKYIFEIEEGKKLKFRLIGEQATRLLQNYHKLVVEAIYSCFPHHQLPPLFNLKLQAFSFICQ